MVHCRPVPNTTQIGQGLQGQDNCNKVVVGMHNDVRALLCHYALLVVVKNHPTITKQFCNKLIRGCFVAKWLKCWTVDLEVPGSSPTRQQGFSYLVYSALPPNVRRCIPESVYTASFGGDVKQLVPEYWLVLAFSCYFQIPR